MMHVNEVINKIGGNLIFVKLIEEEEKSTVMLQGTDRWVLIVQPHVKNPLIRVKVRKF